MHPVEKHLFSFGEVGNAVNEKGIERKNELYQTVDAIAKALNLDPDNIVLMRKDSDPLGEFWASGWYEDELNQRLFINYFMLLKADDIPSHLRPTGMDDPRISSRRYLEHVIDWVQNFLEVKPPLQKGLAELTMVQRFMMLVSEPDKFEKAKQFVLAHEISHFFHEHSKKLPGRYKRNAQLALGASSLLGLVAGGIAKSRSFSWLTTAGLGLAVAFLTHKSAKELLTILTHRQIEIEADLTVKSKHMADPEGGIHFFRTIRLHQLMIRNHPNLSHIDRFWMVLTYDPNGNKWLDILSHPSPSYREKYLKV